MQIPRTAAVLTLAFLGLVSVQADPPTGPKGRKEKRRDRLVQVTYPVADLVIPLGAAADRPDTVEDRLMATIRSLVAEDSWEENGGPARMEYFPTGMSLAVKQTRGNHRELAKLLTSLRKSQDRQIVISLHWVSLPEREAALFRELTDFRHHPHEEPRLAIEAAGASDAQAKAWLRWLGGKKRSSIVQSPRVTLFNGQSATLQCLDHRSFVTAHRLAEVGTEPVSTQVEVGQKVSLLPVIAADPGSVRLHLKAATSWLEEELPGKAVKVLHVENGVEKLGVEYVQDPEARSATLDKVLTIPDGTTLICSMGKKTNRKREEFGPTWFTALPYVNRAFRSVGYTQETSELFLFVSARIVNASEPEAPAPENRTVSLER